MPASLNAIVAGATKNITLSVNGSGDLQSGYVAPTPVPGQIEIIGTGFGTKGRNTPTIWENFSTASNGQLVYDYDPTWERLAGRTLGGYVTTENARYAGGRSAANKHYRGEFETNLKRFTQSRKYFISYWMRIQGFHLGLDYGAIKFGRVNSSAAAGGGGDYNGLGDTGFNCAVTWIS